MASRLNYVLLMSRQLIQKHFSSQADVENSPNAHAFVDSDD